MFACSISNNFLAYDGDMTGVKAIADALSVNSSMTKLNIWNNKIGAEGATAIVNAAPAQMRTLCGDMFEEGQTEADVSGKQLGPQGAILVAWDLRAGFVSTSMTSVDLSSNRLCGIWIATYIGKDTDGDPQRNGIYDATGIKAIANALSVNSSLKILK